MQLEDLRAEAQPVNAAVFAITWLVDAVMILALASQFDGVDNSLGAIWFLAVMAICNEDGHGLRRQLPVMLTALPCL